MIPCKVLNTPFLKYYFKDLGSNIRKKRYFTIDQQIARQFVHYRECFYHNLSFYATQIINPFLTLRLSDNHDKGMGFQSMG